MTSNADENILRGPDPLYEPGEGGLGYEIFLNLNLNKGKIVQNIISTGEAQSYDDLLENSIKLAIYLSKKKLTKKDVICLLSENSLNCLVPFIAAKFIGLNYVSIEPTIPENDLTYLFTYIQPKIIFVSEIMEGRVVACAKKSNFTVDILNLERSIRFTDFSSLLSFSEEEKIYQPVYIEDMTEEAVIFLSSGTTGKPKGVSMSHYSLLGQIFNCQRSFSRSGNIHFSNFFHKFDDRDNLKCMFYSPMHWISRMLFSLTMIFSGGTMIIGSTYEAEEAWQALEKYQPTFLFLPPGQVNELCSYANDKKPITTLDVFATGGGPVSKLLIEKMKRCFPSCITTQGYGQTENGGLVTAFNVNNHEELEMQRNHPDSCGITVPGFQIRIVDLENEETCGVGMQGELRVKSKFIMNGYYKIDSSSAFDSDGWFKTGDLAYFDENHCIYIVDRIKDMLLYTLYNIRPLVIENILSDHPAVRESMVIGYPHPEDNEHPMGVVVLKNEYKNKICQDDIITFVNERVPSDRYKIRAGIKFVDEMLKTPTGKFKKLEMKKLIISRKL